MVAATSPVAMQADAAISSRSRKPRTPLEKAAAAVSEGRLTPTRFEILRTQATKAACSAWWADQITYYAIKYPPQNCDPGMVWCPRCNKYYPFNYIVSYKGKKRCTDCNEYERHVAYQQWLDFEDPERLELRKSPNDPEQIYVMPGDPDRVGSVVAQPHFSANSGDMLHSGT